MKTLFMMVLSFCFTLFFLFPSTLLADDYVCVTYCGSSTFMSSDDTYNALLFPDSSTAIAYYYSVYGQNPSVIDITSSNAWCIDGGWCSGWRGFKVFISSNNYYLCLYPEDSSWVELASSCPDIENQAATACGGAGNVSFFDSELCTYSCVPCSDLASECVTQCDPFNVNAFDCIESTDGSGNITSLTIPIPCGCFDGGCDKYEFDCSAQCSGFYSFTCNEDTAGYVESYDCQCDDCSLERAQWAESNCGGLQYLEWYECETNTGECANRTCNDALQDCTDKCGGSISIYSCDDASGTASNVVCVCECDLDQDNDGLPDNTGDPLTDPDPVNDGEQDPAPSDDDLGLLSKIVTNTKATSENTKSLHGLVDRELNELNKNTIDANNLLRNTNKSIDSLGDKLDGGFELSGAASYQADNVYDSSITQPEENSLTDTIGNYINAGLPLQQFLSDSGFTVSNLDPSMDCQLWGYTVEFDVSPMEQTLNWMGLVVFAVSTISAFMIVIKR